MNLFEIKQSIFLFIVAIAIIDGCKEDKNDCLHGCGNEPPKDTIYSSLEFLPYWYFKTGSMWIYERTDTTPKIFDTAWVTISKTKIEFDPSINSINALEQRVLQIDHSLRNFKSDRGPNTYAVLVKTSMGDPDIIEWSWSSKKILFSGVYQYSSNSMISGTFEAKAETTITSGKYTLPNTIPFISSTFGTQVFLSKNVGISKFIIGNEIWELNYYHLEV